MNKMFILDMGSGNTCRNNFKEIDAMINTVSEIDPERKFILKWQLFKDAPPNIPLGFESFVHAVQYAGNFGYKSTASVFDEASLFDLTTMEYLLKIPIPFVKIACREKLYSLIGKIPRDTPVIVSTKKFDEPFAYTGIKRLCCIPEYPASIIKYSDSFYEGDLKRGISDHTINWHLFKTYKPEIYECHFCIEHNDFNPDAGLFSRTPEDLKEIYSLIKEG